MMKKFTPIVLLELSMAAMVLLLTGALAVQLFVRAERTDRDTEARTGAMMLAQSCAQELMAGDGMARTLVQAGYTLAQDGAYEKLHNGGLTVRVSLGETHAASGAIERAYITVMQSGEVILEWPAARYYNKEVIHP